MRVVQCKHHEPDKTIPPAEIAAEVNKALESGFELHEYYILTTARRSAQCQKALIQLNQKHRRDGHFRVILWSWADIEVRLSELDDMTQDRILRGDSGRGGPAIGRMLQEVITEHLDRPVYASASVVDADLDLAKAYVTRQELDVAEAKLAELEIRGGNSFQPHHWYHLKALRAHVWCSRGQLKRAGRELIDARRHTPDAERAKINEAYGFELIEETATAHQLATALRNEFPNSLPLLKIWLRTAPRSMSLRSMGEVARPFIDEDEGLNSLLAHRAIGEGNFDEARLLAKKAVQLDPKSCYGSPERIQ